MSSQLVNIIRQLAKEEITEVLIPGRVTEVNDDDTIDVIPLTGGAPLLGVSIKTIGQGEYGLTIYPTEGSTVLCGITETGQAVVMLSSEFSSLKIKGKDFELTVNEGEIGLSANEIRINSNSIELNQGLNGGLVLADPLRQEIAKNSAILSTLINVLTAWVPVPQDGGAALKALASTLAGMPTANLTNIENSEVKH